MRRSRREILAEAVHGQWRVHVMTDDDLLHKHNYKYSWRSTHSSPSKRSPSTYLLQFWLIQYEVYHHHIFLYHLPHLPSRNSSNWARKTRRIRSTCSLTRFDFSLEMWFRANRWMVCCFSGGCESRLLYCFLFTYDMPMIRSNICRNVTAPPEQITNPTGKIILVKNGLLDLGQSEIRWMSIFILIFNLQITLWQKISTSSSVLMTYGCQVLNLVNTRS